MLRAHAHVRQRENPDWICLCFHSLSALSGCTDNAYWRNIKSDKNIARYLPPLFDPKTTTVQLMGVLPRQHAKVA